MRIDFRQGLISFQKDAGLPGFLQASATSGYVSHIISPTSTQVAFAHGGSDYLQVFDNTVNLAWGPLVSGITNYLFWDIDLLTGAITYGITTLLPIISLASPASPLNNQHWFDLTTTTMKVWSSASGKWQPKVRVFAGSVPNGNTNTIVMQPQGSQVGLSGVIDAGYIMRDQLQQPLRKSNGEFLTSADPVLLDNAVSTGGVLVQPVRNVMMVRAGENIPAMSLVYFSDADTVRVASSDDSIQPMHSPVGIITEDMSTGDLGVLAPFGEISYDQWDWTGSIGLPLYLDFNGQLTLSRPGSLMAVRVGYIKNENTVLFELDTETNPPSVVQGGGGGGGDVNLLVNGVAPIVASISVDGSGNNVINISAPSIPGSLAGKSDLGHTHTAINITDFSEAVDDRLSSVLQAGSNITLSYDDNANTMTIASTGTGSTYGTTLMNAADAPTARTILGLGTAATSATTAFTPAAHAADTANPHATTKAQVGLSNVDNTADANKPVSSAAIAAFAPISHVSDTGNPHSTTKSQVGLGNVDNTSDVNKPVSIAQGTAIALKLNSSAVSTFGISLIAVADAGATRTLLGLGSAAVANTTAFAPASHVSDTSNPHSTTKAQVGLSNVDNTSDASKPISTATSTALGLKADTSSFGGSNSISHLQAMSLANQVQKAGHSVVLMGASTAARAWNIYSVASIATYQRISGVVTVQCSLFSDADVGRLIHICANNDGRIDCMAIVTSATLVSGKTQIVATEIVTGPARSDIALGSVSGTNIFVHDAQSWTNTHSWLQKLNVACGGILDITNFACGSSTPEDWTDTNRVSYIQTSLPYFDTAIVDFGFGNSTIGPTQSSEVIFGLIDQALQWVTTRARHVMFLGLAGARIGGDSALVASPETTADYTTGNRLNTYMRQYLIERWPTVEFIDIANDFAKSSQFMTTGLAAASTGTTITLDTNSIGTNSYYNGANIRIVSGTGVGQSAVISGYVGSTRIATISSTWTTNPDTTSVYSIDTNDDLAHGRPLLELIEADGIHWTPEAGTLVAQVIADSILKRVTPFTPMNASNVDFVFSNTTADVGGGTNPNALYSWTGAVPTTAVTLTGIGAIGTGVQGTTCTGTGLTGNMSAALSVVNSRRGGKDMQLIFSDPSDGGITLNLRYDGTTSFPITTVLNDSRFRGVDVDAWFDFGVIGFNQNGILKMEVALYGVTATDTRKIAAWYSDGGINGMFNGARAWTKGPNGIHRTPKFRIPPNTYTGGYIQIAITGVTGVPLGTMKIRMGALRLSARQALI
jgi:hypothetical protein